MMIVDYVVVENESADKMVVTVKEYLEKGYKLQGGIAYHHNDEDSWECYAQAMVKESL